MTLTVYNSTSTDSEILTIVSGDSPVITSSGEVINEQYSNFNYVVTSNPISGVTYNLIGILPEGLLFSIDTISGIPIYDGEYDLKIKATNAFGTTLKDLKIIIYGI